MDVFDLPFVQRGVLEVGLLALGAGVLGTWIVLRGLAFFAHATGTAAFPGLVLADGLGLAASLSAFASALVVAALVALLTRRDRGATDSVTAIVLVGALATGVLLASDVFASGARVDRLLFGSLLVLDTGDLVLAGVASAVVLAVGQLLGPRWLATGFDESAARAQGMRGGASDAVLLALVALVAVASLSAIGALLTTALLVVPAATTRLLVERVRPWQASTVALVLAEGVAGLWLSVELNAPPGATIAVLAAAVFALVALGREARRRRVAALLATAALLGLGASGCGSDEGSDGRLQVVASTTQTADLVRQVGGEDVDVVQILRPATDPHDYEPRPRDVRATAGADVVVLSGLGLDAFMQDVLRQSGASPRVVTLGDHLVADPAAGDDPHWWQDPRNVEEAAPVLARVLAQADPADAARFRANAAGYVGRVRRADAAIAACLARVPAEARRLVTDHDAFGRFARRYGITVVGAVIPAQVTGAQPSAGDVADLVDLIERERVRAVFPESSLSAKLARAIAERTGASAAYTLYADTLGPVGSPGGTLLGAQAANADAMVRGFTGGRQRCATEATA